jgi:hypothetical protein
MECCKGKKDYWICIFLIKQLIVKDVKRSFSGNSSVLSRDNRRKIPWLV